MTIAVDERLVTIRLTDEQAEHLRRALISELPWDNMDAPDPQTREEFEALRGVVMGRHERLERLGWEPVGAVREFEERRDVLIRAAEYLLESAGDLMCHPGSDLLVEDRLCAQLSQRSAVLAGYAIAEQLVEAD